MERLQGKVAVITGGTRGFGLEIARAFVREGASVVIASRSQDSVDQVVADLQIHGAKASGLNCDVSELAQVQSLAELALSEFGSFVVWVNNAGLAAPYGPTIHIAPERFVQATRTNILGTYYGSLVAMRHFLTRGSGKLINILGYGERNPRPMQSAYATSKAWVRNFTLALAKEYKGSGVGVYALNPGMMDTEMLLNVEVVEGYEERLKPFAAIVQVLSQPPCVPAERAVWLASSATDGRTGLVARESNTLRMLGSFLRLGANRLLRRPERPVDVRVTSVLATFPIMDREDARRLP